MTRPVEMLRSLWNHPANVNQRWAGIGRYARWQFYKRVVRKNLAFPYHGFVLPGYSDSHSMSAAYYFSGFPDWWEMRFIADYLRPGDRFLDVGANVGLYSLLAAALVGSTGHVDAFEPATVPSLRLQEAIDLNQLNSTVSIHGYAVTDHAGTVDFGFSVDDCQSHVRRLEEQEGSSVSIPAVRLDDYSSATVYAMAKFDIEGHEPLALAGASAMLAAGNPAVMQIEVAGYSKLFGVSTAELIQRLSDTDYDCFSYNPLSRKLMDAPRPWEMRLDNVLAIHRGARAVVEERLAS